MVPRMPKGNRRDAAWCTGVLGPVDGRRTDFAGFRLQHGRKHGIALSGSLQPRQVGRALLRSQTLVA